MSLLDLPIPPRPAAFTPEGAPPGVAVDLAAFKSFDGSGRPWWQTRQIIRPRLGIIHTNGASREGNLVSQKNWANASASNTHPHYSVNAPQPTKFVPTNRRAIGNATGADLLVQSGEVSCAMWSLVVETADAGWPTPGEQGGFLYDHAEIVARIVAYESIAHDFPIDIPDRWNGTGWVTHTWPFPYPHYTIQRGKTCPGARKIEQFQIDVLPRARQIRNAWLGLTAPTEPHPPIPPEDDMLAKIRIRGFADQFALIPLGPETNRRLGLEDVAPLVVAGPSEAEIEAAVGYQLTPTKDGN